MAKLLSTKVSKQPVESMIIEITGEEAGALRTVLANVGGNADDTRRGLVDNVAVVLTKAIGCAYKCDVEGSLHFV